jgi:hypothetical protein
MNYTNLYAVWQALFYKGLTGYLISVGRHDVSVRHVVNLVEGRATINAPFDSRARTDLFNWVWKCWTSGEKPETVPIEIKVTGCGDFTLNFMKSYFPKSSSLEDMTMQLTKVV